MARPRQQVPTYRLHKPSKKAIVSVWNPDGSRREIVLGDYGSPESKAEYTRICMELTAQAVVQKPTSDLTIIELMTQYLSHVDQYYRDEEGSPTGEVHAIQSALRPLRQVYGRTIASDFGPRSLVALREEMIRRGWSRGLINRRIGKIRRMFKWGVSQELFPPAVAEALRSVDGLRAGRTKAREKPPVVAVEAALVDATLPFLPRMARAIVELMRSSGMRPGETCRLKLAEVDRSGPVWVFRPLRHKTKHHGKGRAVPFGPKAQAAVGDYLADLARFDLMPTDDTAPLFDASRERLRFNAERRSKRKTKVQPSQVSRAKKRPQKEPGKGYSTSSLAHAVEKGCKKGKLSHWHPNQLRHLVGTEMRHAFGLDVAQAILGHERADVTQIYAELQLEKAAAAAAAVG